MRPIPDRAVLLIGNLLSSSVGNRAISEEMSARLSARGWSVHSASTCRAKVPRLLDMVWTAWSRRRLYRIAQVDVFSGSAFFWAEAVCALLRLLGKPYVLVLRGGNLPVWLRRWPRRSTGLLASAAAVTAPSAYLVDRMSACRRDIRLIPNAIELADYPFRLRREPRPRLVWLRAFHRVYNPAMAVEVLALVARDFPDATLLMIGPDKGDRSFQRTEEAARRLGLADRVEFSGAVPKKEIARWLSRGDIFLNTTNVDNTPVSVVEAMACGVPVVTTDVGGIPYLLEDGEDALLVPPRNPLAMAAAVRRVLDEPGLAARLSLQARAKAEAFDWPAVLDEWEDLLEMLGRPPGQACATAERSFQS